MPLPRVFISADLKIDSVEKDDAQSLIPALLCQDKMDIAGISVTASKRGIQDDRGGDVKRIIAHESDQPRLQAKSDKLKDAGELRDNSWQGATSVAPEAGYLKATDASRAIIEEARGAAAAKPV